MKWRERRWWSYPRGPVPVLGYCRVAHVAPDWSLGYSAYCRSSVPTTDARRQGLLLPRVVTVVYSFLISSADRIITLHV